MSERSPAFSLRRIAAIVLRHWYLLRSSWPRLLEIVYWPAVQMTMWGFLQLHVANQPGALAIAAGTFLAAVLLWDVLFRGQLGFSISFLEEMWARNLGNLFVSPLRPIEHVLSMTAMGLIRTVIGVAPAALLAIPLYHYSVFELGWPLIAFFVNLQVMGWAVGMMVTALILRYGLGAENLAWFVIFMLAPVSAVYYPVTVLPGWLQAVAWALPSTHVFEGMRAALIEGTFRGDLLVNAALLNLVYLGLGVAVYLFAFDRARRRGLLLQMGE